MGFKGEKVGACTLDRKLERAVYGEVWKGRDAAGEAVLVRLYYDPFWIGALRDAGLPQSLPEHPGLARLVEADIEAHRPFAAWTWADGKPLRETLASGHYLPLALALPLAVQLARALEALHARGLGHHDVRPETVLLDERGRAFLGPADTAGMRRALLARLRDRERPLPEDLVAALTPYIPPEQRKDAIDSLPGDLYQLGVLLYEALCGARPDPFDLRYPSQRDKRIPKVLDELVLQALERRVRARTPSAVGLERRLLDGFERAGYRLVLEGDPCAWLRATPFGPAA